MAVLSNILHPRDFGYNRFGYNRLKAKSTVLLSLGDLIQSLTRLISIMSQDHQTHTQGRASARIRDAQGQCEWRPSWLFLLQTFAIEVLLSL